MFQQFIRVPLRSHGFGIRIEENRIISNVEDARQFMGHDDDGCAQTIAQFEY